MKFFRPTVPASATPFGHEVLAQSLEDGEAMQCLAFGGAVGVELGVAGAPRKYLVQHGVFQSRDASVVDHFGLA